MSIACHLDLSHFHWYFEQIVDVWSHETGHSPWPEHALASWNHKYYHENHISLLSKSFRTPCWLEWWTRSTENTLVKTLCGRKKERGTGPDPSHIHAVCFNNEKKRSWMVGKLFIQRTLWKGRRKNSSLAWKREINRVKKVSYKATWLVWLPVEKNNGRSRAKIMPRIDFFSSHQL